MNYLTLILSLIIIFNTALANDVSTLSGGADQKWNLQTDIIKNKDYDWPAEWEQPPNTGNFGYCKLDILTNPAINNIPLENGDYIGVFWSDAQGNQHCAGAGAWNEEGVLFAIFGDDPFTQIKDGLTYNEVLKFQFYDRSANKSYKIPAGNITFGTCTGCTTTGRWNGFGIYHVTGIFIMLDFDVLAYAEPDRICIGGEIQVSAEVWVGNGPFQFSWTSDPPGFESTLQNPVFYIAETTDFFVWASNGTDSSSHYVQVVVEDMPFSEAGIDGSICENNTFQVVGDTAYDCSSFIWTTSGDGVFNDPTILHPLYTAGVNDIVKGSAVLYLSAFPLAVCDESVKDSLILEITGSPWVSAGNDFSVCSGSPVQLSATAGNNAGILWIRTGSGTSGTFNNPAILNPLYTLSSYDLAAGTVSFVITVQPLNPCTSPASDSVSIIVKRPPTAHAGSGGAICSSSAFPVHGSATNYSSFIWTTNGDGYFENPNSLSTQYFPGINDRSGGIRLLKLIAYPNNPCQNIAQSTLSLVIIPAPQVNGGADQEYLDQTPVSLSGTGSNYLSIMWHSSGTGSFSNPTQLSTVYHISQGDLEEDTIQLILTAYPTSPCVSPARDTLLLLNRGLVNLEQVMSIPAGWSGISSFVKPYISDIDLLFSPLSEKLVILQNNDGIYWPSEGINTLAVWSEQSGYQIKLNEQTDFVIQGIRLVNRGLNIPAGWSFLPVLSECPVDISIMAATHPEIYMIREIAGTRLYWPSQDINSLVVLEPGKSYMIFTTSSVIFTFPDCNK